MSRRTTLVDIKLKCKSYLKLERSCFIPPLRAVTYGKASRLSR